MKILVWHWGKRGAGPLIAARLAAALASKGKDEIVLSLALGAEILQSAKAPLCAWAEPTYGGRIGYFWQLLLSPWLRQRALKRLIKLKPDVAICAMPALLDFRMGWALRRAGIPYNVIVHDAAAHPGDEFRSLFLRQETLLRHADVLFPLSAFVENELYTQGYGKNGQQIVKLWHPPFDFAGDIAPPLAHGGLPRVLFFGRLLPYKGLDLLADALVSLGPERPFQVKVCGDGPMSDTLARLSKLAHVEVDRRWIPEADVPALIAWADGVVLPYREASQSGVAAAALAQGRYILATRVGGLAEQLAHAPNVVLCEPDAAEIANGLAKLFQLPPAQKAADPNAGWAAMADAVLNVLKTSSEKTLIGLG